MVARKEGREEGNIGGGYAKFLDVNDREILERTKKEMKDGEVSAR